MSEGLKFSVSLEDKVSPHAHAAGEALKHLQTELTQSKSKLALFQSQLTAAKAIGDVEGYRKYSELVAEARKETFALGDAVVKAGGPFQQLGHHMHEVVEPAEVVKEAVHGVGEGLRELGAALRSGDVGEALEGMATALAGVASALDLVIPGLGGLASGAIKAAGAVVGAMAEIAEEGVKTALEVAEVNERLTATFEALGDHAGAGKETLEFLNDLSSKLPQSRDQLAQWTKQFQAMGVTDLGELREQIEATASAQAIMGDEGAAAYEKIAKKVQLAIEAHHGLKLPEKALASLYQAGINVTDMADRLGMSTHDLTAKLKAGTIDAEAFGKALEGSLKEKGKGPLEAMSSEITTIFKKGKETFFHLFDGIDIKPLTDALQALMAIGDQANPSGQALKSGIGGAVQAMIKWLASATEEAEYLFLSIELWAVKNKKPLANIGAAFGHIGDAILAASDALGFLFAHAPPAWLMSILTFDNSAAVAAGEGLGGTGPNKHEGKTLAAPGHATGGVVGQPAPGEYFASVAPGEMIIPEAQTRQIMGGGGGSVAAAALAQTPANSNGGGGGVHIDHLELTVQAAGGVTDATSLSVTGLTLALERFQLASGR